MCTNKHNIMYITKLFFHAIMRFANVTQFYSTNGIIIHDGSCDIECKSVMRMTLFSNFIENGIALINNNHYNNDSQKMGSSGI